MLPGTRWIAVGYSASVALGGVQPAELAGLGLEGFRIAPLPNGCFAVSGGQGAKRGAMYGVYELLEQLGLEFMAWDLTVFPPGAPHADLPTLLKTLPATATVQQPSFMYRDLGEWPIYSNRLHGRRMRLNNNAHLECTEDTANRWCKTENPNNMWDSFFGVRGAGRAASPPGVRCTVDGPGPRPRRRWPPAAPMASDRRPTAVARPGARRCGPLQEGRPTRVRSAADGFCCGPLQEGRPRAVAMHGPACAASDPRPTGRPRPPLLAAQVVLKCRMTAPVP